MKTCIIVPVYNEKKAIGQIVEGARAKHFDIIVIDDGSTDDSGRIARDNGAVVIRNDYKTGKGLSLRRGFDYALNNGYEGVITLDGDGQHALEDLEQFIKKAETNPDIIITGNRMSNAKSMPPLRLMTNHFMSWLISRICKQTIPDTQCGYRYIGTAILKELDLSSNDFEIETEVLIKASKRGSKIFSVPIKTIYHNEESKINPFKDTIRFFAYLLREMKGKGSA